MNILRAVSLFVLAMLVHLMLLAQQVYADVVVEPTETPTKVPLTPTSAPLAAANGGSVQTAIWIVLVLVIVISFIALVKIPSRNAPK
jgi:hypothetical protein